MQRFVKTEFAGYARRIIDCWINRRNIMKNAEKFANHNGETLKSMSHPFKKHFESPDSSSLSIYKYGRYAVVFLIGEEKMTRDAMRITRCPILLAD